MVKRASITEILSPESSESGESMSPSDRENVGSQRNLRGLPLRAAVWGGSGAAGAELLRQCLADERIGEIVAFTRRPLKLAGHERARVREVQVDDFLDLSKQRSDLRNIDVAYWCLGVSQLHEPKKPGYRRVTRDFTVAGASALREESPNVTFHFLSGLGAARNGLSPVMWGRVKGEAEQALMELGLSRLHIYRPTFIHSVAGREKPTRGDLLAERLYFRFIPLLTVSTRNIAQAMLHNTFEDDQASGANTYGPWAINRIASAYRAAANEPKLLKALNQP